MMTWSQEGTQTEGHVRQCLFLRRQATDLLRLVLERDQAFVVVVVSGALASCRQSKALRKRRDYEGLDGVTTGQHPASVTLRSSSTRRVRFCKEHLAVKLTPKEMLHA